MQVLIIGSGGREHALAWKLRQSKRVTSLYIAPGNPGTARLGENLPFKVDQVDQLAAWAARQHIDLTVVGPEYPLTLGLADAFSKAGLRVFGPTQRGVQLEASKSFAKEVMIAAGVPTAQYQRCETSEATFAAIERFGAPVVLKADGLAAGKGVVVCRTKAEACAAVPELFQNYPGQSVVVETFLEGVEASFIAATDGERIVPLAPSHDYKRIFTGDRGPNTGGMGTVSPTPRLNENQSDWVVERVLRPVLAELKRRDVSYCGFIYAGLMIDASGAINVLEFNARLGDPETQVILRRMEGDLFELLWALTDRSGRYPLPTLKWSETVAVCVVLAAQGYPENPQKGAEIYGIESAAALPGVVVFHAGTRGSPEKLLVDGGRVLNVSSVGMDLEQARSSAYAGAAKIDFVGRQYRLDIGQIAK